MILLKLILFFIYYAIGFVITTFIFELRLADEPLAVFLLHLMWPLFTIVALLEKIFEWFYNKVKLPIGSLEDKIIKIKKRLYKDNYKTK